YLHTSQGFVVVDGRHNPLPGGQPYGTLTGTLPLDAATTTIPMPVDGGLRRIFVPDFDHSAYTVVQDDTPRVPDPCLGTPLPCPDPDSQTADMAEDPPHTDNNFTSAANAYGVHLLNASGPGAFVQNFGGTTGNAEGGVDCSAVPGVCLTSVAFAPGTREGFLAQTSVGEAKTAGASAFASAARAA